MRVSTVAAAAIAAMMGGAIARAENSPQIVIDQPLLAGTDDLGRTLPSYQDAGPPKPDRWVGLFYWQWHGDDRWPPVYNMTDFLKTHPKFMDFSAFPPGGPDHPTYYWAEPLFGYYRSTDAWVMRKHLVLFADAGVDFLFLDYTNGSVYDKELTELMGVAEDLKAHGVHVPRFIFFLNHEPGWKAEHLYKTWYKPGKFDDMWFRWKGKPLILCPEVTEASHLKDPSVLPELRDYFTWRPTWAFFKASKAPTKWRFMSQHPQEPALDDDGNVEQLSVAKSVGGPIWNNMKVGGVSCVPGHEPVYNDQYLSADNAKGLFFEEQWKVAGKVAPPILMVTGWNEWKASVWETPGVVMLGRTTEKGQGHIVDEFNMDFNRDLEPMKGGYGDDYYWQFVSHLRRYKGVTPPEKTSAPRTMTIDGDFAKWAGVKPVYHAAVGNTADRDADAAVPGIHYGDRSARNDIAGGQVARDADTLYFHVHTASPLSPAGDKNWMTLFINADRDNKTGWCGYDFVIDRSRSGDTCSVERNVGNGWSWEKVGDVPCRWSGSDLELAIPRKMLGLSAPALPLKFEYKWADNLPDSPGPMDFYSKGDCAPEGRFNYLYEE